MKNYGVKKIAWCVNFLPYFFKDNIPNFSFYRYELINYA